MKEIKQRKSNLATIDPKVKEALEKIEEIVGGKIVHIHLTNKENGKRRSN